MLHAAHQHALAEVLELRADAELATGFREAAVGGDQQARFCSTWPSLSSSFTSLSLLWMALTLVAHSSCTSAQSLTAW
jgi:hypothetical protein